MLSKTSRPTIREILQETSRALQPKQITCAADRDLGRLEAEILLGFILKKDKVWLVAHGEETVSPARLRVLNALVARRRKHEPIAHLIGRKEFYGRTFIVNKNVLIPRPETELMIERAIGVGAHCVRPVIWDVGTGSGAIAITLAAEMMDASVLATDISTRAIAVAKKNAKKISVAKRVTFLKSDLLQPAAYRWLEKHGTGRDESRPYPASRLIVVANLPYLPARDKKILSPDVVKYEPSSALFSGSDGLMLIKKFLGQLSRHLPEWNYEKTTVLLEYDPPQTAALKTMTKKYFPKAEIAIHRDLAGRERMMEISLQ